MDFLNFSCFCPIRIFYGKVTSNLDNNLYMHAFQWQNKPSIQTQKELEQAGLEHKRLNTKHIGK